MSGYYDDNFGNWDMSEGEEMVEFYHQLQKTNVEKVCKNCECKVFIQPHYAICNSCAEKIERGGDI
jgi:hypothetical protein